MGLNDEALKREKKKPKRKYFALEIKKKNLKRRVAIFPDKLFPFDGDFSGQK